MKISSPPLLFDEKAMLPAIEAGRKDGVGEGFVAGRFVTRIYNGVAVGMMTNKLSGVGVGVPVRMTWAVASMDWAVAVAQFSGCGVAVTMIGVTQLPGREVDVPVIVAQAVAVSACTAAVRMFSGVGATVSTK